MAHPLFTWQEDFALGHDAMDETHREFVECVNRMLNVGEDGTVDVSAEDAEYFIRDGWTKLAEWESVQDP